VRVPGESRVTTVVQEFREATQLPILPQLTKFRDAWLKRSSDLFFMDLEFCDGGKHSFYEICVSDASGMTILNSTIDHGCSIQELHDNVTDLFHHRVLRKVYGSPSNKRAGNALTMAQVADRLSEYLTPNSLLVEWSASFCNYRHLSAGLKSIGKDSIMPPIQNIFRPNFAWRLALANFKVSFCLSDLYRMLYNNDDVSLAKFAHRAEPDVQMMYKLVATYFKGTLIPREQITRYLNRRVAGAYAIEKTVQIQTWNLLESLGHRDVATCYVVESNRRSLLSMPIKDFNAQDIKSGYHNEDEQLYARLEDEDIRYTNEDWLDDEQTELNTDVLELEAE
jgi:hypothetical protein